MDIYFVCNVLLLDSTSLELTHRKRPWCWERLKVGGEGGDRGWDGWMASPTQRTWVWVNSGSWWWTGKPGVLQSIGLQRVRHDWGTELRRHLCRDMHPFYSLGINFWNWTTRSSFQIFMLLLLQICNQRMLSIDHPLTVPALHYLKPCHYRKQSLLSPTAWEWDITSPGSRVSSVYILSFIYSEGHQPTLLN